MNAPETERQRKERKLLETLEALQLLFKQADHHIAEYLQAVREEPKG